MTNGFGPLESGAPIRLRIVGTRYVGLTARACSTRMGHHVARCGIDQRVGFVKQRAHSDRGGIVGLDRVIWKMLRCGLLGARDDGRHAQPVQSDRCQERRPALRRRRPMLNGGTDASVVSRGKSPRWAECTLN